MTQLVALNKHKHKREITKYNADIRNHSDINALPVFFPNCFYIQHGPDRVSSH